MTQEETFKLEVLTAEHMLRLTQMPPKNRAETMRGRWIIDMALKKILEVHSELEHRRQIIFVEHVLDESLDDGKLNFASLDLDLLLADEKNTSSAIVWMQQIVLAAYPIYEYIWDANLVPIQVVWTYDPELWGDRRGVENMPTNYVGFSARCPLFTD